MIQIVESTQAFEEILANHDKVVIQWSAAWCSHCKAIAPKLAEYEESFQDVKFIKVDIDDLPEVSEKAGIRAMPTFHFMVQGKQIRELVGAKNAELQRLIEGFAKEE